MKRKICLALCGFMVFLVLPCVLPQAEEAVEPSLTVDGARVEKLAGGFRFTEGPAADRKGNVFFSDVPANRIYKWSVGKRALSVFRENTGGANGLFFDGSGNLIACEGAARRVTSTSSDGKTTVIADGFEGRRFNRPNDLWIDPKGGIYFTDPAYDLSAAEQELGVDGVYYVRPDRKNIVRVSDDLYRPNGITGTADGTLLYVTELQGGKTWSYRIQTNGTLADKKLLAAQGSDGMTLDGLDNVYLTNQSKSSIDVYSPNGRLLQSIAVPERPANVTFGGANNRTLFITAETSLYSVAMRAKGNARNG